MANTDNLKAAYQAGRDAFATVVQNERGFWINPANPYGPKTLAYKNYEAGYNMAYTENLSK